MSLSSPVSPARTNGNASFTFLEVDIVPSLARALRTEVLVPAPGLVPEILTYVSEAGERHAVRSMVRGRRAAYLGGLAAATAAGAGAAVVLTLRNRRSKVSLAG